MSERDKLLVVGIADMKLAQKGEKLITYALGSCIGICLYDGLLHNAAMVHIMLPLNKEASAREQVFKYADTGIREALRQLAMRGSDCRRVTAKIAGGAKMFDIPNGSIGNIGQRNIESVHQILRQERIALLKEDVGGNIARTLEFDSTNGEGVIRTYSGRPELRF